MLFFKTRFRSVTKELMAILLPEPSEIGDYRRESQQPSDELFAVWLIAFFHIGPREKILILSSDFFPLRKKYDIYSRQKYVKGNFFFNFKNE